MKNRLKPKTEKMQIREDMKLKFVKWKTFQETTEFFKGSHILEPLNNLFLRNNTLNQD